MNKIFVVFGLVLLLLAGCAQQGQVEKKNETTSGTVQTAPPPAVEPAAIGEGDQAVSENDIPPLPEEEDEKELNTMVDDLS